MGSSWKDLGEVWSGRDLAEGERVTVNVFDKATQAVLEQTTFVPKPGRLDQYTWVMDLCEQVNAQLKLIRAGVQVGDKLEIRGSSYLNKFWNVSDREVQVITTTANAKNWTTDKRVNMDIPPTIKIGSTLRLDVRNAKGSVLETITFVARPGRNTAGLCGRDFAIQINENSAYVRAGRQNSQLIEPFWYPGSNFIWTPFNADFTVTYTVDESQGWTELGEVWSGRDLAEGERVTVNVFDKATQTVLEQITFVPQPGRLDQYTWVMDLCEKINAELQLIRAGDGDNGEWVIRNSSYRNKYWSITPREVQVITTTANAKNWTTDKRVLIDLREEVLLGATLLLKVHNAKGKLLETVSFKPTAGRTTPGLCSKDFAIQINKNSAYVRAGRQNNQLIEPFWDSGSNFIWIPFNADFTVSWSIDLSSLIDLGEVWSGRDLAEGERVTVNVFNKATQAVLEQTTFVPKPGRLDQYTWVMDLCAQVNAQLKLIRAGVQVGDKLEIQNSGYLNKFWGITDKDVQVITTAPRKNNWSTEKRVNIDIAQTIKIGSTLRLDVRNAKGSVLETITFVASPGRNTGGLCGKDFAIEINKKSAYVRAGRQNNQLIEPFWDPGSNFIWIPFNADFTVTWAVDESQGWTELGEVWSGRDLAEGERVTVNVFDKATQTVLEQITFVPKPGRLDQFTWVMDLCEKINAELQLIRAGDGDNGEWVIRNSGYLNKYWSITPREVQVITTTARNNNWTTAKRVHIDLSEEVLLGATLLLKVHNANGKLLETVRFKPTAGRTTPGLCSKDFAIEINKKSAYVRAGRQNNQLIEPFWDPGSNFIWIPFNADFTVSWSIDLSSLQLLGQLWSGRALAEGERVTVNVLDRATQTVLEQTTFVPKASRLGQYAWVMDLCAQVNAQLKMIRAGVPVGNKLEIPGSSYLNKFWNITDRDVQVITTTASDKNWTTDKRLNIGLTQEVPMDATLELRVHNSKGELLETVSFMPTAGRNTPGFCGKDFALEINKTSLYVRAGHQEGSLIKPYAEHLRNWIWIPINADFRVSWSIESQEQDEDWVIDVVDTATELGEVWSGRDLAEGERVTVSVFDKDLQVLLEQTTFVPKPGHTGQHLWPMEMCRHINAHLALIRAGAKDDTGNWGVMHGANLNKYWTWVTRELQVVTTVASNKNWSSDKRVKIDITQTVATNAALRVNVRNKVGDLLETITFTPASGRNTAGLCGKDLAAHINQTSLYLRAGVQSPGNTSLISPDEGQSSNWIWSPANSAFTVTLTTDTLAEACKIPVDRDALEGERITFFAFDDKADRFLDRIVLTARASTKTLAKDQWPAALAKQINASSGHATASATAISRKYAELRLFTSALHLDNWVQGTTIAASAALTAADRIVVKVATTARGNFCEAVTFTPAPARLAATQWAADLATYINGHSLYLKAGVKDTTKKTIVPAEHASNNVIWIPKDSKLKVTFEKTQLKELAQICLEHDLVKSESCKAFVLDDATDTVLREMTFTPKEGRIGRYLVPSDLAALVNSRTELVRAGQKNGDAMPAPVASYYANKIWSHASNVRAFTTLNDMLNFDKDSAIGDRDLFEDEQVTVIVKGIKSGRILESMTFIPEDGRLSLAKWSGDLAGQINERSKFIRAGWENPDDHRIQAKYEADANSFWIPKGSGLEVEMLVYTGFDVPKPGMSNEARELFERCVEAKKYITVDARTGRGELYIPVAELFADDSFSESLKVGISHADKKVFVVLGEPGRYVQTQQTYANDYVGLALRDGRVVQLDHKSKFLIGSDFKVYPIFGSALDVFNPVVNGYKVTYKDGVEQFFTVTGATGSSDTTHTVFVSLVKHVLPSGACLDLEYLGHQLTKISKNSVPLVEIKWFVTANGTQGDLYDTPCSIVVFGIGTSDKKTFNFSEKKLEDTQATVQVDSFFTSGKILYTVSEDEAGRLSELEVTQQHGFVVDNKEQIDKATCSEVLQYNSKGMVCSHIISPGAGMDQLVQDYVYSAESTALTGYYKTASPRSTFVRQFEFRDQHAFVESHGSTAVPYSKRRSQRLDTTEKRAITETCIWEGDVLVDRQTLSVDAVGNPVERINNERITRWTYYNNYQQFKVTETEVKVEDWSLFGCLFKFVDYTVGGAVYGIGGNGGMTWGTRIDSTVDMVPAVNDYAKDAFNLPVAIVHCGSDKPFSGDAESELVLRKVGDKEVPLRLTFYGYANFDGRIRAKQKLTIFQPDCSEIDVTAAQYKVAEKAAEPFIKSLKKQIEGSSGDVKKAFENTLTDLTASLRAQSAANCQGYKLNTWKLASMVLETYDYHTDKDKPGHGTLKSTESVLIDGTGGLLEKSRVKTEYEYSLDPADSNKLIIKTTVSRGNEDKIISSQIRSRLSGRVLGSTDTEGNVNVRTYDPQGNLTSEKVTDTDKNTRETTCTLARGLVWQYDMTQDDTTTRIERDILGRKVAEAVKSDTRFLETRRWTYDVMGRVASSVETDYGPADAKIAIRESTREYDARTGKVSITNVLKDGTGKKINEIKQEQTPLPRGERITQGAFTMERQYNPNKRIMTELYACGDMDSGKIERSMSAEGLTLSVRYLTIDAAKTETEQDKQAYEYDGYGQLTKVTPKFGGATTYVYDSVGRLYSSKRDGIRLKNAYEPNSFAPVAGESFVKSGDSADELLGRQDVDLLGRVASQTVAGRKTEFKYTGASTRAVLKTAVAGPTALSDYESSHDKKTRTLTQKLGGKSSTVVFSAGGQVLSFTDLTGAKTTYEYDFFNRLTKSSNDHCVCTWTYLDNGLLGQETITAVKEKNLTMAVAYAYDGLGQEIRRTFVCPGVDRLQLDRTLLGDGRLKKSVLKVADKEKYTNSYEYDNALRLSKWDEGERPLDARQQTRWATWAYDALGNVTSRTDPVTRVEMAFDYDETKKEQLKKARRFTMNLPDPFDDGTGSWEYDDAGRTTKDSLGRSYSYHGNGQINTFQELFTFSYDKEGRVRGGVFGHDTYTYHYCGDRVYALVVSDSLPSASPKQRTHVLRNESRSCLMQDTDRDGTASRSFELRDASGTVFASVDLATKAITYFRYGPYGERHEGEHENNWLGFKGEPINALGLYHLGNGYRLYDPSLGRFLTRDNKSPFSVGGAAAYVFGNADPVNHQDPSGHAVVAEYSRWSAVPAIHTTAFRVVVGAIGVLLAPFTAGTSILLAMATTALAAISFAFDMASLIISESDPQLSKTLEAWGQAFGIAGAAAGIAMGLHGLKGIPRNWFRTRGTPLSKVKAKWPTVPSELRLAQEARSKDLTQFIRQMDEAKAAGKFDAFKAAYMNNSMDAAGGLVLSGGFKQQITTTTRNLYKGSVTQCDDMMLDWVGYTLDLNSSINVLVQKFKPPMVSETEIKSLVALPLPGLENLFK